MAFKKSKSIHTLLIDVRTRADFEKEHIDNQAILCIEPIVLNRNGYAFPLQSFHLANFYIGSPQRP